MTAIIICNGTIEDYSYYKKYFGQAQFIICADGGADHARQFGIKPDVMLGDFDSISEENFRYFKDIGTEIFKFPAEKDMTDTELAIEFAIDRGFSSVIIIGGIGTRFDHTLSNVFMLKRMLDRGVKGLIVNEHNEITVINDRILLEREENVKVTLLPLTDTVEGVTTKGLYYTLDNAAIVMGSSWGVSNEFVDETAEVSISKGLLLVIKARD